MNHRKLLTWVKWLVLLGALVGGSLARAQCLGVGPGNIIAQDNFESVSDSTPMWMLGRWWRRTGASEHQITLRSNGRYEGCEITYGGGQTPYEGGWSVRDGLFTFSEGNDSNAYLLEQISDNAFRIAGGQIDLETLFFQRVDIATDGTPAAMWFFGSWKFVDSNRHLYFKENGQYEIRDGSAADAPLFDEGIWNARSTDILIQNETDTQQQATYTLLDVSRNAFSITGGSLGGDIVKLTRGVFNVGLADPSHPYVGQYVGPQRMLRISWENDRYQAELYFQEKRFDYDPTIVDNLLYFEPPSGSPSLDEKASFGYNELTVDPGFSVFTRKFVKQSETRLPDPVGLAGKWILVIEGFEDEAYELVFLPDGRYREINNGQITTIKKGTYQLDDSRLRFDPECDVPASQDIAFQPGRLIRPTSTGFLGYNYVPVSEQSVVAEAQQDDAQEVADNAEWLQRIPVTGSNPTLFANREAYMWASYYYYVMTFGGTLITLDPLSVALDPDLLTNVDTSQGQFYDQFKVTLQSSGQAEVRYTTYSDAVSLSPVTPRVESHQGSYRIDGNRVLVTTPGLGEQSFDVLYGRRKIRFDELCYDNTKLLDERGDQP